MKNLFVTSFFTFFVLSSTSYAISLDIVGALNSTAPTVSSNVSGVGLSGNTTSGYGGGLLLGIGFTPLFELNAGALYVQRKASVTETAIGVVGTKTYTFTDLQIPLRVFFKPIPFFGASLGVAYNFAIGNINIDQTDASGVFGGSYTGHSQTYSQAQDANSDMAATAGLLFHFPLGPKWGLVANADYQLGLTNIDTSGTTPTKLNVFQFLAGISCDL